METKRDLLVSQDRLLWEKVCRTITPIHDKKLSSISENIANINDKNSA